MKRRHKAVYNRDTKVQMAVVVCQNNEERQAIVIDHLRNMGFIADEAGNMTLSVGVFNSTLTKYARIKKLLAGNFTANDSLIINQAILGVSMKAPKTEKPTEQEQPQIEVVKPDPTTKLDLEREIACYNSAFQAAQQLAAKIDTLVDAGISREYTLSRYPNITKKIWELDSELVEKKVQLHHAIEKKSTIKSRIEKLRLQLQEAEYDEYLAREEYIIVLRNSTEALDFYESVEPMLEEDLAELDRLKKIKELEEKLTTLKSESKLFQATSAPSTPAPAPVAEKPVAKLEVQLPTEKRDKEIRFLANHLYQVRRGNEEHNPTICRRIAALSAELKLTKAEFCKKILSISVQCWDDRHKRYFTDLGLHLHGERRRPTTNSKKKDPNSNYKETVKKWADTHLISADGNDVLNSDVYDSFVRDTGFSDIAKISFYNILARSLGYTHKCKYRRDAHGKTCCDTYYAGYRLV